MKQAISVFFQRPIVRYAFLALGFILVSAWAVRTIMQSAFRESRAKVALVMTYLVENEVREAGWQPKPLSDRLKLPLQYLGFEFWVLEENGSVLTSSAGSPMPVDWEQLEKSTEEYEPAWTEYLLHKSNLATIKLMSRPTRYVVVFFDPSRTPVSMGLLIFFLFSLWIAGGMYVIMRYIDPTAVSDRPLGTKGFSLVSAVLSLGILGLGLMATTSLLKVAAKSGSSADLRLAIRSLSDTVRETVDCEKTFAGVDPVLACSTINPLPILLKDKNGNPITQPLSPGAFQPTDQTCNGAGVIGGFLLRANCVPADSNLYVRFAKVEPGSNCKFLKDSLLKRPYDWSGSANPLYGAPDRILCKGVVPGTPENSLDCQETIWVNNPLNPQFAFAQCAAPRKVLSGGCRIIGGTPTDQDLTMSYPDFALNRWQCQSSNVGRITNAKALCCKY